MLYDRYLASLAMKPRFVYLVKVYVGACNGFCGFSSFDRAFSCPYLVWFLPHEMLIFLQKQENGPIAENGESKSVRFLAINRLEDPQAIRSCAFHPNGKLYVIGTNSKQLHICRYPTAVVQQLRFDLIAGTDFFPFFPFFFLRRLKVAKFFNAMDFVWFCRIFSKKNCRRANWE